MMLFIKTIIAKLFGTFITTCPRCYGYFWGFSKHHKNIKVGDITYRIICNKCVSQPALDEYNPVEGKGL